MEDQSASHQSAQANINNYKHETEQLHNELPANLDHLTELAHLTPAANGQEGTDTEVERFLSSLFCSFWSFGSLRLIYDDVQPTFCY